MARATTLGNGNLLVGLDKNGELRDLYYPYVGESNHVSGASGSYLHRIGIWCDGETSWLNGGEWSITHRASLAVGVAEIEAEHERLGITITIKSAVHNEYDVFIREFVVANTSKETKQLKLFLAQQFRIYESRRGDTGYFDPRVGAIVHYKGDVSLLVNSFCNGAQFTDYNIGLFGIEGKEGTWHDAHDGVLERNPIEHGSVDSIIGHDLVLKPKKTTTAHYWIVCGDSIPETHLLDKRIKEVGPSQLINSTGSYWQAWLEKEARDLSPVSEELKLLFERSLLVMRVHADNRGGIIASSDTDMLHHGRDCYSYVWPRDAAIIAYTLDGAGYADAARRSYDFFARSQEPEGYLMHKYRSDGVLGSSWHPWMLNGESILPIQEDETATVLHVLYKHFEKYKDIEYIESMYDRFIEPAANFLVEHIEPTTGLPLPSFDLWEEKYGISTYTAASVCAGLRAAHHFASLLGKEADARTYEVVQNRMKDAIKSHLYDKDNGYFYKQLTLHDDELVIDHTVDTSSLHGLLFFEIYPHDDPTIKKMVKKVEDTLRVGNDKAGFVRYEGDNYYRLYDDADPNPWVICTLWMARFYIQAAENKSDLKKALTLIEWVARHTGEGGLLAEQMNSESGDHLSASPLVWSHAEYVLTVTDYLEKLKSYE